MKNVIFIWVLFSNFLFAHGQKTEQYIVFSVTGGVTRNNVIIQPKQLLKASDKINIPEYSQISIFDEEGKRLYSIGETGIHQVSTLIKKMKPSVKQLTNNYMKFIKDQLFGNGKKYSDKTHIGSASTIGFRGEEEDMLFLKSVLQKLDYRQDGTTSTIFANSPPDVKSDYNLMFELVSYKDQSVLQNNGKRNNPYYLQVTNADNVPLFVNVLIISENGDLSLMLPPHEQYGFSNYLVPANSVVSFREQPYINKGDKKAGYILLGSEIPVDYRVLESDNHLMPSPESEMKVGVKLEVLYP